MTGVRRPASHDLAKTAGVSRAHGVEGSLNPQKTDYGVILQLRDAGIVERLSFVLLDEIKAGPVVRCQKGGAHHVRTGFHRDLHIDGAVALSSAFPQPHANVIGEAHSLAVNDEFQLLAGNVFTDAEILD